MSNRSVTIARPATAAGRLVETKWLGTKSASCANDAAAMLAQVSAFVNGIAITPIDPEMVISKALTLYEGTVAAGGNRYETQTIAKYEFKTGTGTYVLPDGSRYDGAWSADAMSGFGTFTPATGAPLTGVWRDAVLIERRTNAPPAR